LRGIRIARATASGISISMVITHLSFLRHCEEGAFSDEAISNNVMRLLQAIAFAMTIQLYPIGM